jgi:hypothetical protein
MIPRCDDIPPDFGYDLATQRPNAARLMTIKNGLYSINTKLLDGVDGGATGISVLRNGKILGGGSILYHFGSYDCSDGKWKGEVTSQEHTPSIDVRPLGISPVWDLPERIPTTARNLKRQRLWASEAFD